MNYLWCVLDETMTGETMALTVIEKINSRLKFLYRKNRFLDVSLRRLLCNSLIQPHFDYACTAWYPQLTKKLKDKLQVTQNKCREHISNEHFQKLNSLPINQRFKQCVTSTVFKFVQNKYPAYMNEVFRPAENKRINTRNSYLKSSFSKNQYRTKRLVLYWTCYLEQNSRNFEEKEKFEYFQT